MTPFNGNVQRTVLVLRTWEGDSSCRRGGGGVGVVGVAAAIRSHSNIPAPWRHAHAPSNGQARQIQIKSSPPSA